MKNDILGIKPPKVYQEGIIKYEEGVDNFPDWIDYSKKGYTWKEHLKLDKLIAIEHMNYSLNDAIEDNEITEEEIQKAKMLIEEAIKEYNNMDT